MNLEISRPVRGVPRIFFSVAFAPLIFAAGVGVDYLRISKGTGALRQAMDGAARVAIHDVTAGEAYFVKHVRREFVEEAVVSFVKNPDGSISGVAKGAVTLRTGGLLFSQRAEVAAMTTVAPPTR